jgi:hypothetical protein
MQEELKQRLKKIRDKASDAAGTSGVNGAVGALIEPYLSFVADCLDQIETTIAAIRNPSTPQNLTPTDVGSVLAGFAPGTTSEYADDVDLLAEEAYQESLATNPVDRFIGDRLATISYLIPGYKTIAGIT